MTVIPLHPGQNGTAGPRNPLPVGYQLQHVGDAWFLTAGAAVLEFGCVVDHRDGLVAEVTATSGDTGRQHWSRLSLAAPRSRSELARRLNETLPLDGDPWGGVLDTGCRAVVEAYRQGTPSVALTGDPPVEASQWLIHGLIPLRVATMLYGDGGAGKSITALAVGLAGLLGQDVGGSRAWKVRPLDSVLYLDWEADQLALLRRLRALCRGLGLDAIPPGYRYLRMDRPLADSMPQLSRECAEHSVDLLIVDSWAPACGPQPEGSDAATRTMGALRSLGLTALCVAHVTKASADSGAPSRPYGSVFNNNLARSTLEATGESGARTLTVTFRHQKSNDGEKMPATALTYTFSGPDSEPEIAVESDAPDLTRTSLPAQIIACLRDGAKGGQEMADILGAPVDSITRNLRRMEGRTVTRTEGGQQKGRGRKVLWGLLNKGGQPCQP